MADLLFTISSDVLPANAHVVSIKGKEGLSELYRFEIGLRIDDPSFELEDAIRGRATLTINAEDEPYQFHGMFASVELLHEWEGKSLYRAILVPQLWQLLLTRHSRVFTGDPITEIIETVLQASELSGDDYSLDVQGSYDVKEFVAQYKESNFHFLSRWMEREGMYYFFEQGGDKEKLIIVDAKGLHEAQPGEPVRYVPGTGQTDVMSLQSLGTFRCKGSALPASVEMLDYDYLNPALEVKGTADVVEGFGEISIWDDNFTTSGQGNHYATIRAEELKSRRKIYTGTGRVFHLRPGYLFTLDEHPRDSFNIDYLTVELTHYGNQSANDPVIMDMLGLDSTDEYRVDVKAIPADVQYRSPDRFPWPRIEGYESAIVCGKASSQYAQVDEHGRYHVRILFDESDLDDGDASAWVRMQQPYGGGNEGWHFPWSRAPRCCCSSPAAIPISRSSPAWPQCHKPSPVTNENYTLNIITTINNNLIQIEDNSGHQYIYVYCPIENTYIHMGDLKNEFNFILNTEGHAHFHIGGDQVINVDLTLTETVELDVTFNYNQNWLVNVIADTTIEIGANLEIHVCADVNFNFDTIWAVVVLADVSFDFKASWTVEVAAEMSLHVCADVKFDFDANFDIDVASNQIVHIHGDRDDTVDGKCTIVWGEKDETIKSDWKWKVLGHEISVKCANETNITFGLTNDVYIGIKNGLFIGGQNDVFIGHKRSLALAGEMSAFIGAKLDMALAIRMEASLALDIKFAAGAKAEFDAVVDLRQEAVEAKQAGPVVHITAITIIM